MFPVLLRSIKEKHKNVSFLRFVDFSKNLSKLFSGSVFIVLFFAPQLYTPIKLSQSPANHALNPLRSNQIEQEPGEPRRFARLSSQARSHTPLIPYRVNNLALSRKSSEWG